MQGAGAASARPGPPKISAPSPQQMEGGGLSQIKQIFDRLAVDAIRAD
jgi:hypothetical protein